MGSVHWGFHLVSETQWLASQNLQVEDTVTQLWYGALCLSRKPPAFCPDSYALLILLSTSKRQKYVYFGRNCLQKYPGLYCWFTFTALTGELKCFAWLTEKQKFSASSEKTPVKPKQTKNQLVIWHLLPLVRTCYLQKIYSCSELCIRQK